MAWTLLRPTGFMQNTLAWGTRVLNNTFYSPVPDAAFSIVDARDVAEVAAVALTEDGHEGKAYGLSGPEAVSYRDQAKRLFKAAGPRHRGRGDPDRDAQARARPRGRPALERRGPQGAVRGLRERRRADGHVRRQGRPGPRPARHRRVRGRPRGFVQGERNEQCLGRGNRDVRRRQDPRGLLSGPATGHRAGRAARVRADDRRAARDAPGSGPDRHRGPRTSRPQDTADAYLRLHLLSHRLVKPREINVDGIFGALPNVAWTSAGPVDPANLTDVQLRARQEGRAAAGLQPRQVPAHDRLRDAERRARGRRRPRPPRRPPRRRHDGHARGLRELQRGHARALDGRGPDLARAWSSATAPTSAAAARSWAR